VVGTKGFSVKGRRLTPEEWAGGTENYLLFVGKRSLRGTGKGGNRREEGEKTEAGVQKKEKQLHETERGLTDKGDFLNSCADVRKSAVRAKT